MEFVCRITSSTLILRMISDNISNDIEKLKPCITVLDTLQVNAIWFFQLLDLVDAVPVVFSEQLVNLIEPLGHINLSPICTLCRIRNLKV